MSAAVTWKVTIHPGTGTRREWNTAWRRRVAATWARSPSPSEPRFAYINSMCDAYNLRHRNEAILDIARALQLAVANLPEFPPRHCIGIKQRGLILRPDGDGP